jgi:hypothetical protein
MRCIACNKILTEKEEKVSYDYCHECLSVISEDLREWEDERDQMNKPLSTFERKMKSLSFKKAFDEGYNELISSEDEYWGKLAEEADKEGYLGSEESEKRLLEYLRRAEDNDKT